MVAKAGAAYVLSVFAVGFACGAVRVTLLLPQIGATLAVLAEAPIMLAASWFLGGWCIRRFVVPARPGPRVAMGAVGFALLMGLESGLAVLAFGQSIDAWFAAFATPAGMIGLLAQLGFAAMPLLRLMVPPRGRRWTGTGV